MAEVGEVAKDSIEVAKVFTGVEDLAGVVECSKVALGIKVEACIKSTVKAVSTRVVISIVGVEEEIEEVAVVAEEVDMAISRWIKARLKGLEAEEVETWIEAEEEAAEVVIEVED